MANTVKEKVVRARFRKKGNALEVLEQTRSGKKWMKVEVGDEVMRTNASIYIRESKKRGLHLDVWDGKDPSRRLGGVCERKCRIRMPKDGIYVVVVKYENVRSSGFPRPYGWYGYREIPISEVTSPLKRVVREEGLAAGRDEYREMRNGEAMEVELFWSSLPLEDRQWLLSDGDVTITEDPDKNARHAVVESGTYSVVVTEWQFYDCPEGCDYIEDRYKVSHVCVRTSCDPEVLRAALKESAVQFGKDYKNYPRY